MDTDILKYHAQQLSIYNFYEKRSSAEWLENHTVDPICVYGDPSKKTSKCTVVITTYKRPWLLERAINSVLDQRGYDDFIIIVADNEGIPIREKTETQALIERINDDRIVYYRYNKSICSSRNNAAVSLVRSEWFLILHDDDVLHKDALNLLMTAIKGRSDIDMLCVQHKSLADDDKNIVAFVNADKESSIICRKIALEETIFVHKNEFTGALMRLSAYEDCGGIPEVSFGCGDIIFASVFNAFYNRYYLESDLYGVVVHSGQTSSNSDGWYRSNITKYYWFKAGLHQLYGRRFCVLQETLARAYLFRRIRGANDGYKKNYGNDWGVDEGIIVDCIGIPRLKNKQIVRRWTYKVFVKIWESYIRRLAERMQNATGFSVVFRAS